MAERRMFTKKITESDAFLDMPSSSQMLYFHFSMNADDDGFINNPKKIQRMCGASDDDFKLLVAKSFVILFDSGIIVIKHWKMHNYIQNDRYRPTDYVDEKSMLGLKKNKAYTLDESKMETRCIQDGAAGKNSVGKDRIDEDRKEEKRVGDTTEKESEEKKVASKRKKTVYFPEDELLETAFQEFLTMRNKIKKPLATDRGIARLLNKLQKLSGGDNDLAVKILEQSVDHCWQDIYKLKVEDANQGTAQKPNIKADSRREQLSRLLQQVNGGVMGESNRS